MHESVSNWVKASVERFGLAAASPVLEVGSMDVNGSVRSFFRGEYTGVDVAPGPGVDLVVAHDELPFERAHFAIVVSTEMLEHTPDPLLSLKEMRRVLKPGGVLLLTTRSPGFPYHHPPDYHRFTPHYIDFLLRAVGLIDVLVEPDSMLEHPGVFVVARAPVEEA